MFKFSKLLLVAPAALGIFAFADQAMAQQAPAADPVTQRLDQALDMQLMKDIGQVTSVSQLRDVKPTDWAFQALQSLVERYGCIAGYPDGTFRGNRAMTRYEFAAGLNACLDRVNELIASATADLVSKEDLAVLQRLQEEFQAELATLRGRVDALEARTAELEAQQFSTTTKLAGEAVMDLGGLLSGSTTSGDADKDITLASRVRLALNTSFTGKDLLRTRLQANNIQQYSNRFAAASSLPEAAVEYASGSPSNNIELNELWYRFPIGKGRVWVGTHGLDFDKIVPATASYTQSYAFNDFLEHSPNIYKGPRGAGAGFNYPLTSQFNIAAAYLANTATASSAGKDGGLTGGPTSMSAQLTFTPNPNLVIAAAYARNYNPDGSNAAGLTSGTSFARNPFSNRAMTSDNVSLQAGYRFSPKFNISGWAGWSWLKSTDEVVGAGNALVTDNGGTREADATVFNWAINLGFPDLLREGNYGGIGFGAAPYVTDTNVRLTANGPKRDDDDTPYVVNAFYSFKVSDNIAVQPQVFYLINPDGSDNNDNIWAGSVRTTFRF